MYNTAMLGTHVVADAGAGRIYTVIVGGNGLILAGLTQILTGTDFTVSSSVSDVADAAIPANAPRSMVLFHAVKDGRDVLTDIRTLRGRFPDARLVIIADHADLRLCVAAHDAGADGCISLNSSREVIIKSLELVALGEKLMPVRLLLSALEGTAGSVHGVTAANDTYDVMDEAPLTKGRSLSAREREILCLIKEGSPNKVIARQLEVTEATVKVHVKAILRKIGASNRTQAAMWAAGHIRPAAEARID